MAFKAIPLLLFSLFGFLNQGASAQTDSSSLKPEKKGFYSITRNKAWTVSQYMISSKQTDKKSSFSNCTFKFNQDDTSTFLIENTGAKSMAGHWNLQGNDRIIFSLPLISEEKGVATSNPATAVNDPNKPSAPKNTPSDSVYNEVAKMLSGGPMQIVEIKPTKLKFKLHDAFRGEVLVEFLKKD